VGLAQGKQPALDRRSFVRKILSFRSRDSVFKAYPGVVPDDDMGLKAGITVVKTPYQHNELSEHATE
jgi:hypothetical protein